MPISIGFWKVTPAPIPIGFKGFIHVYTGSRKCRIFNLCSGTMVHALFEDKFQTTLLRTHAQLELHNLKFVD